MDACVVRRTFEFLRPDIGGKVGPHFILYHHSTIHQDALGDNIYEYKGMHSCVYTCEGREKRTGVWSRKFTVYSTYNKMIHRIKIHTHSTHRTYSRTFDEMHPTKTTSTV